MNEDKGVVAVQHLDDQLRFTKRLLCLVDEVRDSRLHVITHTHRIQLSQSISRRPRGLRTQTSNVHQSSIG